MAQHVVHTQLPGRLVMLGCGSIGQAVLPLILRHLGVTAGPDHHRHRRRRAAATMAAHTASPSTRRR